MKKLIGILVACWLALLSLSASASQAIQPFEPDSLARIVKSQRGKPFILVVWSLDCAYCQASLSTLMQEKRTRKNVNIVTLATDSMTDPQVLAQIKKKLKTCGMETDAWAFGSASPEKLRYAVDPKWHGEMPRSYWFNSKGEREAYSGVITAEIIAKFMPGT